MKMRSTVTLMSLVAVAAAAACGDDTTGGPSGSGGGSTTTGTASSTSTGDGATSSTASGAGGGSAGGGSSTGGVGGEGGSGGGGGAGGGSSCVPVREPLPLLETPPDLLSATGLYADVVERTIAEGLEAYSPRFPLWSDAAEKSRWIHLPECEVIDTTDMDHWQLPVGTRIYKEFAIDGVPVETRVMHRFKQDAVGNPAEPDWWFATYVWNDDGTDAVRVTGGAVDANGTSHDVPTEAACFTCHGYLAERVLGFSAVQLAHDDAGFGLDALDAGGLLSVPAPEVTVPGDAVAQAALGVLHANCGNCHNDTGIFFFDAFHMRLLVDDATVEDTGTFTTAVGVETTSFEAAAYRIAPGNSADSCVTVRMGVRGGAQMPPLGTEVVDTEGLAAVDAWIAALGAGG